MINTFLSPQNRNGIPLKAERPCSNDLSVETKILQKNVGTMIFFF